MHHHNQTYGIGIALLAAGAAVLAFALMGAARRQSSSGQRLLQGDPKDYRGQAFVGRNYYMMKWAPINAAVGIGLMIAGGVLMLAS